jgi:Helix-turn-helix domain
MDVDLITVKDLKEFKAELIIELRAVLTETKLHEGKSWIKGNEVKKLLNLSESKLQKLRIQGMLPSSKIGGAHYYRQSDIEKMFKLNVR